MSDNTRAYCRYCGKPCSATVLYWHTFLGCDTCGIYVVHEGEHDGRPFSFETPPYQYKPPVKGSM